MHSRRCELRKNGFCFFIRGWLSPTWADGPKAQVRRPQEYDFEILDGSRARSGPNSDQIREIGPEWAPEMRQNIGNPYQMEDKSAAFGGAPRGRRFAPPPWNFCLPFGKGFLCFASFPGPILGRFSRFVPNLVRVATRTHPGFQNSINGFSY